MRDFEGKWVLVTGARRGLGRAIVSAFVSRGANIIAHARKPDEVFAKDMSSISHDFNVEVRPVYFDLSQTEEIKREVTALLRVVKPDVLVNNAGRILGGQLFSLSPLKLIREIFEVNLFAHMYLTQLVLKGMVHKRNGCIVNVASIAGLDARPGIAAYGSSKAAMIAWTRILAAELGTLNVRVNAIAPGMIDTGSEVNMGEESVGVMLATSAMHRLGRPEEVADIVCFLASNSASYINGEIIRIDGGLT